MANNHHYIYIRTFMNFNHHGYPTANTNILKTNQEWLQKPEVTSQVTTGPSGGYWQVVTLGGNAVPTSGDMGLDFFSQINETSIHPYMFQGQDKFKENQDKIVTRLVQSPNQHQLYNLFYWINVA